MVLSVGSEQISGYGFPDPCPASPPVYIFCWSFALCVGFTTRPKSCMCDLEMVSFLSTAAFSACLSTLAAFSPSRSAVPDGHRDLASPNRPPVSAGVVHQSKSPTNPQPNIWKCIFYFHTPSKHVIRNTKLILGRASCCFHVMNPFPILVHVDMIVSSNFCRFFRCNFMLWISCSSTSQRCSTGFRAGDWKDHWRTLNSSSCSWNQLKMTCVL